MSRRRDHAGDPDFDDLPLDVVYRRLRESIPGLPHPGRPVGGRGEDQSDVNGNSNGHSTIEERVRDLEVALKRIPSVTGARIVSAPTGRITEIHVLSHRDRSPKQVVRDVQSVALASFGIEIDYRTVSVVQLEDLPTSAEIRSPDAGRISLRGVTTDTAGLATEISVHVALDGREETGRARGPGSSGMRLVARAVADAVGRLLGDAAIDVDFAEVSPAGPHSVSVCVLRLATARGDLILSGSAVVRKDATDAMARAALAALNRLVAQPEV